MRFAMIKQMIDLEKRLIWLFDCYEEDSFVGIITMNISLKSKRFD